MTPDDAYAKVDEACSYAMDRGMSPNAIVLDRESRDALVKSQHARIYDDGRETVDTSAGELPIVVDDGVLRSHIEIRS